MKFYGRVLSSTRKNWLNFGGDLAIVRWVNEQKNTVIVVAYPDHGAGNDPELFFFFFFSFFFFRGVGILSQPRLNIFTVGNMRVMICLGQGGLRSLSASSFQHNSFILLFKQNKDFHSNIALQTHTEIQYLFKYNIYIKRLWEFKISNGSWIGYAWDWSSSCHIERMSLHHFTLSEDQVCAS